MKKELTFLVIIDDSKEMLNALRYATLRASRVNGTVALLATFDSIDFSHWKAVENIAEEEFRKEAENKMKKFEKLIMEKCSNPPKKFIMKGDRINCILEFLKSNKFISNLILASSDEKSGPGPLISGFTGKHRASLHVPLTIIPGNLSEEEIDNLF